MNKLLQYLSSIFGCFVTDNAANIKKMRDALAKAGDLNIIYHGCSAHILNLSAKDLELSNIKVKM